MFSLHWIIDRICEISCGREIFSVSNIIYDYRYTVGVSQFLLSQFMLSSFQISSVVNLFFL